jgi:hypothetical protein
VLALLLVVGQPADELGQVPGCDVGHAQRRLEVLQRELVEQSPVLLA